MKLRYIPNMLICSCCGRSLPETDFYRQSITNLPYKQCKACCKAKAMAKRDKKHGKFVSSAKRREMQNVNYTQEDWAAAMIWFEGRCCYSGEPPARGRGKGFDREHLIPLSYGGKTTRYNIAPCKSTYNRSRGNRPLLEWYREQPFWSQEREDRIIAWLAKGGLNCEYTPR